MARPSNRPPRDPNSPEELARARRANVRGEASDSFDTLQAKEKRSGRQRPAPRTSLEELIGKADQMHEALVVGSLPAHVEILIDSEVQNTQVSRRNVKVAKVHPALVAELNSPLVVGDRVRVAQLGPKELWAVACEPRQTLLARPAVERERYAQPLVSNAGVLWAVVAMASPPMRPGLVDRMFVAAAAGGLEPRILVTKCDLPSEDQTSEWLERYESLGFAVIRTSIISGEGLDTIRHALAGPFSVLVGQSGVGKSSIVRAIIPEQPIAIGEISQATGKGRHTTTVTRYYKLPEGGAVVDTPGLRELGLWGATREHLDTAFPDVTSLFAGCRFDDCRHLAEPGCAVRDDPSMPAERLASWHKLSEEIDHRAKPGWGKPGGPS